MSRNQNLSDSDTVPPFSFVLLQMFSDNGIINWNETDSMVIGPSPMFRCGSALINRHGFVAPPCDCLLLQFCATYLVICSLGIDN